MKIEHQLREKKRIASSSRARSNSGLVDTLRSPNLTYKVKIPRCACKRVGHTFGGSRFPGLSRPRGRIYNMFSNLQCRCRSEVENRRLEEQYQREFDEIRKTSSLGKCPHLHRQTMRRIENPKRFKLPRCSCVSSNSTTSELPCRCLSPAQHQRLETIFGRRAEHQRRALAYKRCLEETMSRSRRHSSEEEDGIDLGEDQESETPIKKHLRSIGQEQVVQFWEPYKRLGYWWMGKYWR